MSATKNPIHKPRERVFAALDIGSTKVSIAIATANSASEGLKLAGVGTSPNVGIRQGVVVNIEATTDAIKKARDEAELMAGYKIEDVWIGIAGVHIKSFDSKGMVAIRNREVTSSDIDRVIEAAKAVAVPADRKVLHVLPREYKVDGQDGITDPIGMSGVRLEASVHIVTAGATAVSNTLKCIERAGLRVAGLVLEPLASARSVLCDDEKHLGVCVADMGGGACNLVYLVNGSVAYTSVVPVGGQHFTHDVAIGLRTPQSAAEDLKRKYGCAMASLVEETETIEADGVGGRKSRVIARRELADVLEARAEETLNLIATDIRLSGLLPMLGSGVILTGGSSQLVGLVEMGEFIFDIPVRRGVPHGIGGLNELARTGEFATVIGLLLYGFDERKHTLQEMNLGEVVLTQSFDGFAKRVKDFFGQLF